MCYVVFLSTSSPEDLAAASTALVRFSRDSLDSNVVSALRYPHKWYVGSATGCSCTFRHLTNPQAVGFGRPEDWMPEEEDELRATADFIAVVRRLAGSGYQVDCIDAWEGTGSARLATILVDLNALADDEFRFFENHHFIFRGVRPSTWKDG